jgi:hypothetical protein
MINLNIDSSFNQNLIRREQMSVITKTLEVAGDKGESKIKALFDTGSSVSFIKKSVIDKLGSVIRLIKPEAFTLGNSSSLIVTEGTILQININGNSLTDIVYVTEKIPDDLIIGASTMQKFKLKLDLEKDEVIIDPEVMKRKNYLV